MFGLYKFCISRFGMLLGHAIFCFVFGYIAGIMLLFLFGGAEQVSYNPIIVWKNLILQWGYWNTNKDQLGEAFVFKFFMALTSPLLFSLALKIIVKVVLWPLRKIKKKQTKKPKETTDAEHLKNIEEKLDALKKEMSHQQEKQTKNEKDTKSFSTIDESTAEPSHTSSSKGHDDNKTGTSSNNKTPDIIVMPPPEEMNAPKSKEQQSTTSKHPPSIDSNFISESSRLTYPKKGS